MKISLYLLALLALPASATVLIVSDDFDDGATGTNSTGIGTGFTEVDNGTGSTGESGSQANVIPNFTGGSSSNVGLYSNDAVNSTGISYIQAQFNVNNVTGNPRANGLFFGLNENNSTFYRTGGNQNFGFILDSDNGAGALTIRLTANDVGGNNGGTVQLVRPDFTLAQLQDGFTLDFTVRNDDTFDWAISGLGASDGSGTGNFSGGITYATQFDTDDRLFFSAQKGGVNTGYQVNVNSVSVSIPEPSHTSLLALALLTSFLRRRRA